MNVNVDYPPFSPKREIYKKQSASLLLALHHGFTFQRYSLNQTELWRNFSWQKFPDIRLVQFGCTLVENKSKPDVTTKLELLLHILRINLEMALDILRRIQEMPLQNLTMAHK